MMTVVLKLSWLLKIQARALATGRIVPVDVLEAPLEQVPRSVAILAPLVDYYAEIKNDDGVDDVELVKPVGSWEDFRKTWLQYVRLNSML